MNAITENSNLFADLFINLKDRLPGSSIPWLDDLRSSAMERFRECGIPTSRVEEWKYINLSRALDSDMLLAGPTVDGINREFLEACFLDPTPCHRMVFVNGYFRPDLSELGVLPTGVKVSSIESSYAD